MLPRVKADALRAALRVLALALGSGAIAAACGEDEADEAQPAGDAPAAPASARAVVDWSTRLAAPTPATFC